MKQESSAQCDLINDSDNQNIQSYKLWRIVSNILVVCIGKLYMGYVIAYFPVIPINQIINEFQITMDKHAFQGLFSGLIPVGAGIGGLISSIIVTRMSRRHALLFVCYFSLIGGVLVQITTFETLFIGRIIQGLCVGSYTGICSSIVKQLSPVKIAGTLGALTQFSIVTGIICTNIISNFVDTTGNKINPIWRYIFAVPLLLALIQAALLHFVYPNETIKYLLLNDRLPEAIKLIQQCYHKQYVDDILKEKQDDIKSEFYKNYNKQTSLKSTVMALHLGLLQQMSGVNVVILYGSSILNQALPGRGNLLQTVLNLLRLLGCIISMCWLLKRFGRKILMQTGLIVLIISTVLMGTAFLSHSAEYQNVKNVIIIIGLCVFMLTYGYSLGPVVWLYLPQIVQPKIVSIAALFNWMGASICVTLFPIVANHIGSTSVFYFLGGWMFASFIFNQIFMMQTKGKTEKQINDTLYEKLPEENIQ